MGTIATVIQSRPARERMMDFLASTWRPFAAVLEGRPATKQEVDNKALWPTELNDTGSWAQRIGFVGATQGMARAWEMSTIRWVALHVGRRKFFPKYDLPLRRSAEFPSAGKVPFWVVGYHEPVPLLVDSLWTPELLLDGRALPLRLQPFIVDRYGMPREPANAQYQVGSGVCHTDDSFGRCIREELARLELLLGDGHR